MGGMFVAKAAEFLGFHPVRMVLFFLGGVVIALLAVGASKGYFWTHNRSLLNKCLPVGQSPPCGRRSNLWNISIKKRLASFGRNNITWKWFCQIFLRKLLILITEITASISSGAVRFFFSAPHFLQRCTICQPFFPLYWILHGSIKPWQLFFLSPGLSSTCNEYKQSGQWLR